MENIFVEFLPPWVETGIQPAFYDKESGTVLQQTARMYARVNMLIRMFNKLSKNTKTTVEEYIKKFNDLHDYVYYYFDNLDVQEEINNKLDQMYEDGQLTDIIAAYIQLRGILVYNTVAEMKLATNLADGSFAETYGYYSVGDNGGSKYKIRTITNQDVIDESRIIALYDNTLVAELVLEDEMNVTQFGLKGDGITDDSNKLNIALASNGNNYLKLTFNTGTYLAKDEISLYSNTHIDLQGATIKSCHSSGDTGYIEFGNGLRFLNNLTSTATAGYGAIKNIEIENGTFDGDESGVGFFILHGQNINVHDVVFKDCCVGTHVFDLGGCKDVTIKNCKFDGYLISNASNYYREMIQTDYASGSAMPYWGVTPNFDNLPTVNLLVDNCEFSKGTGTYYPSAIGSHSVDNSAHEYITITNCKFNNTSYASIRLVCAKHVRISNNTFTNDSGVSIRVQTSNPSIPPEDIEIIDNKFSIAGSYKDAIKMEGHYDSDTSTYYYVENVTIKGNQCTSNWNGDDIDTDSIFIEVANCKEFNVSNNVIYKCKYFLLKDNNSYFKDSKVNDNKIRYSAFFIVCTNSDTQAIYEACTNIVEADNIWEDATSTFNINNFKLTLRCSAKLTADQTSQTYYFAPFDERTADIGSFATNTNYQYLLPRCIRRFKLTGTMSNKCGSNTSYKVIRLSYYNPGSRTYVASAQKTFSANQYDTTTFSAVVDRGCILPSGISFGIGLDAYLQQGDTIEHKFGPGYMTTLTIEGF